MSDIKHVLVPVLSLDADQVALEAAASLAGALGARCTVLIVSIGIGSEFAHVHPPLSALLADIAAGVQSQSSIERQRIQNWLDAAGHDFEVRDISIELAVGADQLVSHARYADLIILGRSNQHQHARREMLQDLLFKSARPLLLLPERDPLRWDRVLVAWNASAQSTRAVTAALPLLRAARKVQIVTVDAKPERDDAGAPGRELAAYLQRHGVTAAVLNKDGLGRETSETIVDAAVDVDADVIVLGAYGHSRAREFVLGGVSRDLLAHCDTALFLAH